MLRAVVLLAIVAPVLVTGLTLGLAGCGGKGVSGAAGGVSPNPSSNAEEGPLMEPPGAAASAAGASDSGESADSEKRDDGKVEDGLYVFRQVLEPFGYSFRIPEGWRLSLEERLAAADLVLRSFDGTATILIARRPLKSIRHYGHWIDFRKVFEGSIVNNLNEVRVTDRRYYQEAGMLAIALDHVYVEQGGDRVFSRKIAYWAGDEAVVINFTTTQAGYKEKLPVIEAFAREFRLIDPERAKIDAFEIDYVGNVTNKERGFTMPMPRGFEQVGIPEAARASIFMRIAAPPSSVSVGEHKYSGDLRVYGDYQRDLLAKRPGMTEVRGELRILGQGEPEGAATDGAFKAGAMGASAAENRAEEKQATRGRTSGNLANQPEGVKSDRAGSEQTRQVYLLFFTTGAGTPNAARSMMAILQAPGVLYQPIFASDPLSWPYMEPLFLDMLDEIRF